jgi:hypothetical protein
MIVQANFEQKEAIEALELGNTFFERFIPSYFYVVLHLHVGIGNWFTILSEEKDRGDKVMTAEPSYYPEQMFKIVDDTIPQDWSVVFFKEWGKIYSVQEFNILRYADTEHVRNKYNTRLTLFPSQFHRNIFVRYCDHDRAAIKELEPYLHMIRQQQNEMNQK